MSCQVKYRKVSLRSVFGNTLSIILAWNDLTVALFTIGKPDPEVESNLQEVK